jgi:glutathionylspermidine synthase
VGEEAAARPRGRQRLDPGARRRGRCPRPYDDADFIYQACAELGEHDRMRPVIGLWVSGDRPAGIGIRESAGHVTGNTARFVPQVVDG